MRFRATKERRKLREEFVYKWAGEIAALIVRPYNHPEIKTFVDEVARKEIEYGPTTNSIDIFFSFRRTFYNLFAA